ncbi:peptide chain release factor N(5)-glutamine methyltransferase [sulfur-oxidizing endosymbiont of Gigantopelta aegis]|uniref:peptide chain release factor N(5)-glutamine methyltransferase n=1 Tax=sulfur-oxidizing endosymbiont of Gigantopelta aegis TaxID=2794934 RepID=UPI0018DE6DEB|nr:peptide chain release factor N(5)-glutamine methyltransferase [sulfur-oxidizing endosymbiont of Gigantopelta aegis]
MPLTIAEQLKMACQQLGTSDSPKLDCEILLLKVLNEHSEKIHTKTWLLTWPETLLTPEQSQQFDAYLALRSQGMPIAYITGNKDFWSFSLQVSPDTLIPRPETELLVECVLEKVAIDSHESILDLGTGSGAIALAIASERPNVSVLATDFSQAALAMAKNNASMLGLNHVSFCRSHWFDDIPSKGFEFIVSNPPYIAQNDPHLDANVKDYEPLSALIAEQDGLADIALIIAQCQPYLKSKGWLLFEHGFEQAPAVQQLLSDAGFDNIETLNDINRLARVTLAQNRET